MLHELDAALWASPIVETFTTLPDGWEACPVGRTEVIPLDLNELEREMLLMAATRGQALRRRQA